MNFEAPSLIKPTMPVLLSVYPHPSEINFALRRAISRQQIILRWLPPAALALAFGVWFLLPVPGQLVAGVAAFVATSIWGVLGVSVWRQGRKGLRKLAGLMRPLSESEEGSALASEVLELSKLVAKRLGTKHELPIFHIEEQNETRAYSSRIGNLLFSNNVHHIGVSKYALQHMQKEEFLALFAHELAHFHLFRSHLRLTPQFQLGVGLLACVLAALPTVWFSDESAGLLCMLLGLLLFSVVPLFLEIALSHATLMPSQFVELAADGVAAEVVGPTHFIGALIFLKDRDAARFALLREFNGLTKKYPDLDPGGLAEKLREKFPKEPIGPRDAAQITLGRSTLDTIEPIEELAADSGPEGSPESSASDFEEFCASVDELTVVFWRDFDTRIADGRLDEYELEEFVQSLVEDQRSTTHWLPSEHPSEVDTHPTTKARTLYLYEHYVVPERETSRRPRYFT